MHCPHCNGEIAEAERFCPECGARLVADEPAPPPASPFDGFDFSGALEAVKKSEPEPELKQPEKPESPERFPIRVAYNTNLFFLSGSQAVMKLQLTPLSGEVRQLQLFMETQTASGNVRQKLPIRDLLITGRSIEASCTFTPQEVSGMMRFSFYVGCQTFHETKYYSFSVEHKVYDPRQSGSTIGSIIINQNMGEKSYVGENNLGAIREIARKAPPSAYELIDRLNSLPPNYQIQTLHETLWKPSIEGYEGVLYRLDEKERLALEWNGYTIYLIAKRNVALGRSPQKTDLLVRTGGSGANPRAYPNNTVSGLHVELLYCEDAVNLFDRSSYGTYINGRRPSEAGIAIPDEADVEFGDICWHMQIQHCSGRTGAACEYCEAHGVKSLAFSRKDGEKEYYLLVWQCCELGRVIPELAGWVLLHLDGAFLMRLPDGKVVALQPGTKISFGTQKIVAKYFQQI